jgi:myo-inositol 2-dehydrogenase/D-chiro-inositol 1-dehydrogenase
MQSGFSPSLNRIPSHFQYEDLYFIKIIKLKIHMNHFTDGIFHDCAVHDIDLTCWILGEYPSKVYASACAHMKHIADIDDHDSVAIQFTFPSGAMASIDLSRFAIYGYDQRLEVFGPEGMLQCGNQNALGVSSYKGTGVSEAPIWYSFASRYDEAYKRELDHFLNVVEG